MWDNVSRQEAGQRFTGYMTAVVQRVGNPDNTFYFYFLQQL